MQGNFKQDASRAVKVGSRFSEVHGADSGIDPNIGANVSANIGANSDSRGEAGVESGGLESIFDPNRASAGLEFVEANSVTQRPESQKFMTDVLRSDLRMRCPNCRKLYSVRSETLTNSAQPLRFECVSCPTRFGALVPLAPGALMLDTFIDHEALFRELPEVSYSERHQAERGPSERGPSEGPTPIKKQPLSNGTRSQSHENKQIIHDRECPKCRAMNLSAAIECRSCGLVFSHYRADRHGDEAAAQGEIQLGGTLELMDLWSRVSREYDNETLHQSFVQACHQADCLPFASHKYARVLSVLPGDEIAKRMRKRIVGLASVRADSRSPRRIPNFRLPGFNSLVILLATIVMIFGLALPGASDLTGVGGAMLALAVTLRFFVNRNE
jgi:hypothetical protein